MNRLESRRGMNTKDHSSLKLILDKKLVENKRKIYLVRATMSIGKKEVKRYFLKTVYCNTQHDYSIDYIIRRMGFNSFETLEIDILKEVGESVAEEKEITKWKYKLK